MGNPRLEKKIIKDKKTLFRRENKLYQLKIGY